MRIRSIAVLLGLTVATIATTTVIGETFTPPPTRQVRVPEPRSWFSQTIKIADLRLVEFDEPTSTMNFEGRPRISLVTQDGESVVGGPTQEFMSELSDDLTSGMSSVQVRVGSVSSLVTMNAVGYDCCGEDGRLSIGLLLPMEGWRQAGQILDQQVMIEIQRSGRTCSMNEPRQDCRFADFTRSELKGSILLDSSYLYSSFEGSKLDGLVVADTSMIGSSFRGASLRGALFRGVDLEGVDFTGADLAGAVFSSSNVNGAIGLPRGFGTAVGPRDSED